ncbi:ABC transporter permease [Quisquiliibacterium transsilvanicum]|uniref:Lipoprotein-releasing system permease protein n=1 Tax=Quisquiliibacterium transsilvanicum TaxID=1549638 RepID=A0A7W8M811_9BURK|nr:ABC transporter permease [Quisquiliibacterium transsilvanicum]MBB5270775.1 lipoprotein-releasing system permease protein [Quisquiliibacterium transsilvanicum]
MTPRLPFEWLVALRYLREGRLQTALILTGVTAGVAVIIFLSTLIDQLQVSIIERTLGSQPHVVIRPPEEVNLRSLPAQETAAIVQPRAQRLRSVDQWESVMRLAAGTQGVVAVSPLVSGAGFALRGNASRAIALMGVEPDSYRRIVRIDRYLVRGRFDVGGAEAVIGTELARDLGVSVGDKIRVVSAEDRDDLLTVVGLFDIGNRDLNRRWVFVPLRLAQSLLDLAGGVSSVDLTVDDIFAAEAVAARLRAQTGLNAESWMQTNAQLLAALRNQSMSNSLIRGFVVAIVAVGIASVLVVSVVQKQREIGILRAMGTSPGRIMLVFLLQGAIHGLVGSLLGVALGIGLLEFFSTVFRNADGSSLFAADVAPAMVAQVCGLAVLVGLMAAALPARRAAKMDPVQAIRM